MIPSYSWTHWVRKPRRLPRPLTAVLLSPETRCWHEPGAVRPARSRRLGATGFRGNDGPSPPPSAPGVHFLSPLLPRLTGPKPTSAWPPPGLTPAPGCVCTHLGQNPSVSLRLFRRPGCRVREPGVSVPNFRATYFTCSSRPSRPRASPAPADLSRPPVTADTPRSPSEPQDPRMSGTCGPGPDLEAPGRNGVSPGQTYTLWSGS